jgi:hypothetical protein
MSSTSVKLESSTAQKSGFNSWPLLAAGILSLLYFAYSLKSKGFYQQDEANHYLSMLRFWYDPTAIMGNWAKPGYKILYVLTALGGQKLVVLQNCLLAGFSCFFAYKTAEKLGASNPWIAFVLLGSQPLWISLSFRNYSEFPAGFLLVLAFYFYVQKKMLPAAIIAGLICTIRQEFYPIAAILGVSLLIQKHWIAAFSIALFPIIQNLAGYYFFGDPLYLYNQILGTSTTLKDAYERMGFDHYFLTSAVVFGPVALSLFVLFLGQMALNKKPEQIAILVATLGFFLINCLFNWKEVHIGPATGGNLRYMCIISPLVAVCAALALDRIKAMDQKIKLAYIILPYLALVGIYLTYKHNFLVLTEEADNVPLVGALFACAFVFIPVASTVQTVIFTILCAFMALVNVKAIKLSDEDKVCQEVAKWYKDNEALVKGKPLYNTHIMFYYFIGKVEKQFSPEPITIADTATMEKAPVGSIILWESHYGYRPNYKRGVPYEYFAQSGKYKELQVMQAADNRFAYVIMEKQKL